MEELSGCDSVCDFLKNKRPQCSLAGEGDVCDRKSRRFAIEVWHNTHTHRCPERGEISCNLESVAPLAVS